MEELKYPKGVSLKANWQEGKGEILVKEVANEDGTYNVVVYDETTGDTYTKRLIAEEINAIVYNERQNPSLSDYCNMDYNTIIETLFDDDCPDYDCRFLVKIDGKKVGVEAKSVDASIIYDMTIHVVSLYFDENNCIKEEKYRYYLGSFIALLNESGYKTNDFKIAESVYARIMEQVMSTEHRKQEEMISKEKKRIEDYYEEWLKERYTIRKRTVFEVSMIVLIYVLLYFFN